MNTLQSVIDHSCISNLMYSFVFGEALQWDQSMKNQVSLLLDFQLKILRRTQHAIFLVWLDIKRTNNIYESVTSYAQTNFHE